MFNIRQLLPSARLPQYPLTETIMLGRKFQQVAIGAVSSLIGFTTLTPAFGADVLHRPGTVASKAAPSRPAALAAPVIENGRECTVINFEGVGNQAAIPEFDGIQSPGWLGIIDQDAGGTGNFANEPTPQTIAFWLGGNPGSRDIVMTKTPASRLEFYYASAVAVTMQALDDKGNVLATSTGPANYNTASGDPNGDYNRWDPLKVETDGNKIKTVRVTGNTNQTGIDNLKVCTTIGVEAVEMTQAIQQFQELKDLKASLDASREPPVPLVAGKSGVLRLYTAKVTAVTDVTIRLSGAVSRTLTMPLQPNCSVEDQRRQKGGCRSFDFYLTPPEGNWDIKAEVVDSSGKVLETHDFPFKSRKTDTLSLKAVSVCDARDAAGAWQCAPASALASRVSLLRKLAPTRQVSVEVTGNAIRRATAGYTNVNLWWMDAAKDANDLFGIFDWFAGVTGEHRTYFGMVRTAVPGGIGGIAHDLPSHAALGRTSAIRLGTETVNEMVSHEVGHTLGLHHTNTQAPGITAAPPGCYNLAADSGTDWPFGSNTIQSMTRPEVAFDVAAHKPLLPEATFEIMSYCVPRWISPFSYKKALTALGGGSVTSAGRQAQVERSTAQGSFWTISGAIRDGSAVVDPVFDETTVGPVDAGTGTHRIEVQDAAGAVLFLRQFTPSSAHSESSGPEASGPAVFFELIPVQAGAARVVVFNPADAAIGTVAFGGSAPVVRLLQPAGGGSLAGQQAISWTVTDADSATRTAKVFYAPDGINWRQLARQAQSDTVTVDFDQLPGATGTARIKVVVSDGVNSAAAVSAPFSVPRKALQDVQILAPLANAAYPRETEVQFEGTAYDVDDGMLDDTAVTWRSSLDGVLGNGAFLATTALRPGTHAITMSAVDSDGNTREAATTVRIAGAAPLLTLGVTPLDTLPTTCTEASIIVDAGAGGVGIDKAEYSLDGGVTWTQVPANRLPYRFIVPGSGYIHLVARVFDQAGQLAVRDAKFFVNSACAVAGPPRFDGVLGGQGAAGTGSMHVDVVLRNGGQGPARAARLTGVALRTLSGTGTVTLDTARSPALPLALPDLAAGASHTVRLYFNVPAGVKRFSVTENGELSDIFGRSYKFSINQSVIP